MRNSLLAGIALLVAAAVVVVLGAVFGLELDSVALLGVALGAVVALVPDGRPGMRLAGFLVGFVTAWFAYLVRAGYLPDSNGGRFVAVALVIVLCVAVAAATAGRLPLWAMLVGTAAMVGAFEAAYTVAPSQVLSTSTSTATTILLTAAVGFLAAAFVAPSPGADARPVSAARRRSGDDTDSDELSMMETAK